MVDKWLETKVKKRKWRFKYIEHLTKRPKRRKGRINATQYAQKTGTNTYRLTMKGKRT